MELELTSSDQYILLCALISHSLDYGCAEADIDILKKFRSNNRFSTQFDNIDSLLNNYEARINSVI